MAASRVFPQEGLSFPNCVCFTLHFLCKNNSNDKYVFRLLQQVRTVSIVSFSYLLFQLKLEKSVSVCYEAGSACMVGALWNLRHGTCTQCLCVCDARAS